MTALPADSPSSLEGPAGQGLHLSIVIPIFNEKDNLVPLWDELVPALQKAAPGSHEVIFVDDGSRDGSTEILRRLRDGARAIRLLRFPTNTGQSAAIFAGFRASRGRVVVTLDGDRQNDPADIPRLLDEIQGYDAVVGYRLRRADNLVRRLSSWIGNAIRNLVSGDDIIDTGCTLKAFRRECLADLPCFRGAHRFLPTLIRMAGFRVLQIPVGHRPRVAGGAKYGIRNRLIPAAADLLAVRWMRSRRIQLDTIEEI